MADSSIMRSSAINAFTVSLVAVSIVSVAVAASMKLTFGIGITRRGTDCNINRNKPSPSPLAVMYLVPINQTNVRSYDSFPIVAFNELYASVGVGRDSFARWQQQHGFVGPEATSGAVMLAPGYPILSKIAWMYVDPITLTPSETKALIGECDRAGTRTTSDVVKQEIQKIKAAAIKALRTECVVRFGPP